MRALLFVCLGIVSAICVNRRTYAGPWSTEPVVGLAAEYASNPELLAANPQSETHAAVIADVPVNYDLDDVHFAIIPRVRYSGATGYSSVTSNYFHLDTSAKYTDELGSIGLSGAAYRDSSLLYAGEVANGVGVRRDTTTVDANWLHSFSERLQLQIDANTARTLYSQSAALTNLVDYRYSSVLPGLAYSISERDTLRLSGAVSRYNSLNQFTTSNSDNLQVGFDRRLTELWTLSALVGYSKSTDQYRFFFGNIDTTQNGAVYSVNLVRQSDVLALTATASRALTPTGFAFLSRQDSVSAHIGYNYSERWTFGVGVTWANIANPVLTGGSAQSRFYNGDISANWYWTEQWVVTFRVSKIAQQYETQIGRPSVNPTSNGVSFEISRHFNRSNQ